MLIALILTCEIAFWLFLIASLAGRYCCGSPGLVPGS
jgi:hypothetical protein